jgi:D-tyrosyl-tRNA(Tyr) deacylase
VCQVLDTAVGIGTLYRNEKDKPWSQPSRGRKEEKDKEIGTPCDGDRTYEEIKQGKEPESGLVEWPKQLKALSIRP